MKPMFLLRYNKEERLRLFTIIANCNGHANRVAYVTVVHTESFLSEKAFY